MSGRPIDSIQLRTSLVRDKQGWEVCSLYQPCSNIYGYSFAALLRYCVTADEKWINRKIKHFYFFPHNFSAKFGDRETRLTLNAILISYLSYISTEGLVILFLAHEKKPQSMKFDNEKIPALGSRNTNNTNNLPTNVIISIHFNSFHLIDWYETMNAR